MTCQRFVMFAALLIMASAFSIAHATPTGFPVTEPVHFLVLGDTGTGDANQLKVARAMEQVCAAEECQFAIVVGDNIYEKGARSVNDGQFATKFEQPYAALHFPFFMVLGNHDQSNWIPGGGVNPSRGDVQVRYTEHSARWMMPARFYKFAAPVTDPNDFQSRVDKPVIDFFFVDSNLYAPQQKIGPAGYRPGSRYDRTQRLWLRESIAQSQAAWKVFVAHHPYRNNGKHGNAGEFEGVGITKGGELKKLYESEVCGKVDFVFSGHDHTLQWLHPWDECGSKPEFVISGAGAKTNHVKEADRSRRSNQAFWEAYETLGFYRVEATRNQMTLTAYTVDSEGRVARAFERTVSR